MLVSGMIVGSLFTLFVVPSIYMLVARRRASLDSLEAIEEEIGTPSKELEPSVV
jgi:hypothetical protein